MRRWARHALLAGAVLAGVRGVAAGQYPDLLGQRVVSVEVDIEGVRTTDPGLADLVATAVGKPLDARDVRESIAHLMGLRRFEDVRISADAAPGGVAIRVDLLPIHSVRRFDFRGTLGMSESRLRRAIDERFGLSPSAVRSSEVVTLLEEVYRDNGYLEARVDARSEIEHAPERTTLVFNIDAGPRLTLFKITPEGNLPDALAQAPARIGIAAGQPYDKTRIRLRLDDYVGDLKKRGYYEATAEPSLTNVSADQHTGELVITFDAGPHMQVSFAGDTLPKRLQRELVPIEREGSVDDDLLEDSARRIEEYFHGQGFREATAIPTKQPRDGELAIVFRISRGPEYKVGRISASGNTSVPEADLLALVRVRTGTPLVEAQLDADAAALKDLYQKRGFSTAKVVPVVLPEAGPPPIEATVQFQVQEGPRTVIGSVTIQGHAAVPETELRRPLRVQAGAPYYEPQLAIDRDSMVLQYLNRGYRSVQIPVRPAFNSDRSRVDLVFQINEGPQFFVDHVLIVGYDKTSISTIRRELTLKPGDPLGLEAVNDSQRRLSALGLFRRARITELDHGSTTRRDLVVTVEEAPATSIGYGGGVEVGRRLVRTTTESPPDERFEYAPRGFFEIGRRNLFGRNRSVNLFTRASLRLRRDPVLTTEGEQPATDFHEYRVLATYRQPRVIANTDLLVTAIAEQGVRTSFDFNRQGGRLELARHLRPTLSLSLRYELDRTEVFNESLSEEDQLLIDRLFPQVRLSSVSSSLIRDTRDDPLGPSSGELIGLDAKLAGQRIGSQVGFAKTFLQGFMYRKLPGRRGVVFATGARLGLSAGFARTVTENCPNGEPECTVDDLPASERFFAGGDTTVRGFSQDQLGTTATLDENGFPKGGNAVIVLNAEVRVPVWRDFGAVAFVDAGNVFARIPDIDVGEIRGSVGVGLRYRSPIGPLRFDIGFKLDRQVLPNGQLEQPHAIFISLGQAF
jgi:outer membrane protein insertion porin family